MHLATNLESVIDNRKFLPRQKDLRSGLLLRFSYVRANKKTDQMIGFYYLANFFARRALSRLALFL